MRQDSLNVETSKVETSKVKKTSPAAKDAVAGLTSAEAVRQFAQYGENALVEHHQRPRAARASSGADSVDDRD